MHRCNWPHHNMSVEYRHVKHIGGIVSTCSQLCTRLSMLFTGGVNITLVATAYARRCVTRCIRIVAPMNVRMRVYGGR